MGLNAALLMEDQKPDPKPPPVEPVEVYGIMGGGATATVSPGARHGT